MIEASIKKRVTEEEEVAKAKTKLAKETVLKPVLHQCWDSKVSCFS